MCRARICLVARGQLSRDLDEFLSQTRELEIERQRTRPNFAAEAEKCFT